MTFVRLEPPAKINLRLRVLAREEGGHHQIETLFQAVDLRDVLILERIGGGISLEVTGADVGPVRENLVYRAASAFLDEAGMEGGLSIRLEKRIPAGAGLGGGSSDAAATLLGLDRLLGAGLERGRLVAMGARLGADVPFFVSGAALALAWGRGERVLPLPPLPRAPVLLAFPRESVSTREAYRALARHRERFADEEPAGLLSLDDWADWDRIEAAARNAFEPVVFEMLPELRHLRERLDDTEPRFSLLSGSGSAVFAVYATARGRDAAAEALRPAFESVRFVPTWTLEPPVHRELE